MDNNKRNRGYETPENIENSLKVDAKNRKNNSTRKINRLWMWLGVIVLVLILLYWIFAIGTFEGVNQ